MVRDTIEQVRRLLAEGRYTKASLARRAGLHPNTLRDADGESWNPTAETLLAVEGVIHADPEQAAA